MGRKPYIVVCSSKGTDEGDSVLQKEVVFEGNFVKKDPEGNVEFRLPVDEKLIDHWVATFNKMQSSDIDVPVPVEHTTNPDMRRGTTVKLFKKFNEERGVNSLYAHIKFSDPETAKRYKDTDVSLYSPPEFIDGQDNKYMRPIRHIALTDYPVIPGLSKFETVAASFGAAGAYVLSSETNIMTFAELATQLGIDFEEGADDDTIAQSIVDAWEQGEPDADDMGDMEDTGEVDDFVEMSGEDDMAEEDDEEENLDDVEMSFDDADPLAGKIPVSASMIKQVASARRVQLDQLRREGKISPATRDRLANEYASDKKVNIALSQVSGDNFETVLMALSQNTGRKFGEQSGRQDKPNRQASVITDAENRAKAHNKASR